MLLALFPIGDDNSDRRTIPYVTYALLAINVLVFVALQGGLFGGNPGFTYGFSVVPYEITHGQDLVSRSFSSGAPPQFPGPQPIFLTVLSAMFMHGSWGHLFGNMLYLFIFGDNIEDAMGHVKFLLFYLLCGALATFAHIFSDVNSLIPSLGASGAIAGVLGGYILLYPSRRVRVIVFFALIEVPALLVIGLWAAMQFFNGFGSIAGGTLQGRGGVAYLAHVGGFVAGLLLVKLFANNAKTQQKMQARYNYPMQGYYDSGYERGENPPGTPRGPLG